MASTLSVEQFRCSICLDIFKNPVTIPCGHNFCLECIKRFWDTRSKSECPLCKDAFKKQQELRVNLDLKDITEKFKRFCKDKHRAKSRASKPPSSPEVICDVCHRRDVTATMLCVACKTSPREFHLTPDLRDPVMSTHRLMDAAAFSSAHLCKKHNQLLTMFCEKDQKPVCVTCTETNHKHHHTITINNKSKWVKTQMTKTRAEFQQMIQARIRKTEEIQTSVELSKINKEREIETSVQVFSVVVNAFERSRALFIAEVEQKHEVVERRAEEILKTLGQEIQDLQKRCNELQYLENTEDSLHQIQKFPPLTARLPEVDWCTVTVQTDMHAGRVRRDFSKLLDLCHELQKKLCAHEVIQMNQYAVDVTLDPVTAAGWLTLSPDHKKVSISGQQRRLSLPDEPRRFDSCVSVLGQQRFTCGKSYWVVQVGDKTDWDLGVAKESINRKGTITVRPDSGFWAICRRKGGSLIACAGPSTTLQLQETPQKVGIFLDYEEGLVSFYDAEAKTHIYTYSGCTFTEPLYPYFNPCVQDNGKNVAPLVICPVEVAFSEEHVAF